VKTEERVIGGFRYRMTQVEMDVGEQIVLRLGRPVTALFSRVAEGGTNQANLKRALIAGLGPALAELSGKDLRYVRKHLAARTVVFLPDGKKLREWPLADHYNEHFAGRYPEALQFLKWGIEMNRFFGDAVSVLDAMFAKRKAEREASSSSPPLDAETVGGSGDSSSPTATGLA
jgi:hypothetical protein